MACCSWPGPLGFPGVGVGFRGVGRGGVSWVGGAVWLGAALSFYGNFPEVS